MQPSASAPTTPDVVQPLRTASREAASSAAYAPAPGTSTSASRKKRLTTQQMTITNGAATP
jgi:hypothetical protein